MTRFETVMAAYQTLPTQVESLMLSTINADGTPQASYAPYVMDEAHQIYILTSGLSTHTRNLLRTSLASVLIIEDESQSQQVFARQRLTYDCTVSVIERHSPLWEERLDQFEARFGEIIQMLRQLEDFQLFCLAPQGGRFVMGFGAAYEVDPENLAQLKADVLKN